MTGPFNTIGHETEQTSREASARLMHALSELYAMLESLERGDVGAANDQRPGVLDTLKDSAAYFDQAAEIAGDYALDTSGDQPHAIELADLYRRLAEFGYRLPLSNRSLSQIAASEVRRFREIIDNVQFKGSPEDWLAFRTVIDAANRLLSLGLIIARISALHGH